MSRRRLAILLVAGLLIGGAVTAGSATAESAAIVAVYPNPVADGDTGEFVVVALPTAGNWSVSDGESTVQLSGTAGRIAISNAPARTRTVTDVPVRDADLQLANGGERLTLRRNGSVVATVRYEDAPSGQVYRPGEGGWQPLGATDRPVVRTAGGRAVAFVLPDAPSVPIETLRAADERILLAGYTLTSERVADALLAAAARGVRVRVLVEGKPVDGMPRRQAHVLDRLASKVQVAVVGGPATRYEFHHPKYAVVDDRAVVLTENWKPAGTGGRSSRGWGVVLDDSRAVRALAATFRADASAHDAIPWRTYRRGRSFESAPRANGSFPTRHEPTRVPVRATRVLVAPDNAERGMVSLVANATDSIRVIQPTLGRPDQPMVRAVRRAARRGVQVRILLSSAWYSREDNRELADYLTERTAESELAIRLADPAGRFGKVHAKGVIVDGDQVAVGSLNWNDHSATQNREVVVVMDGAAVAGYYARVFDADWRAAGGGGEPIPVGLAGGLVAAGAGALALARRIQVA